MKVLVTGGRDYMDSDRLESVLNNLHRETPITAIVHGGASGADLFAGRWANDNGVGTFVYRADWNKHGKAAGPIRNREMCEKESPDLVVAFPGGRGTANMISIARDRGVKVLVVEEE